MNRIYDTMTSDEMAKIIYNQFEVDQSCVIYGFELVKKKVEHKGNVVLELIRSVDRSENTILTKQGYKRKLRKWSNSIGGPKPSKTFRWDYKMIDNEPRYTIWRVQ